MLDKVRIRLAFMMMFGLALTACDDDNPAGPAGANNQVALVLNSISGSISIIDLDSLTVRNDVIQLGANSSAVGFSVRGNRAIVPNGTANNVLIVDIENLGVLGTIDLPDGSGASGSVFFDDNTAFVCNLNLGSVARLNLSSMSVTDTIPVGQVPSDVAIAGGKLFVANANVDLSTFQPLGNGQISVIDVATSQVTNTIDTGGTNSQFLAVDPEGDLIVVNSGQFVAGNGSISVIDPETETRTGPFAIGDFPGDLSINDAGIAFIASFSNGLYSFDTQTNTVLRSSSNALAAQTSSGSPFGAAGVDFDAEGNIYSANFGDAVTPGTVFVFNSSQTLVDSVKVGIGPFAVVIPEE